MLLASDLHVADRPYSHSQDARNLSLTETYTRPPVFEAGIEAKLVNPISQADFDRFEADLKPRFANHEEELEFQFRIEAGVQHEIRGTKVGARFTSGDAADIVVLKRDALLVARLAPYQGWESLLEATLEAWAKWTKIIGRSKKFSRLGVRYQNRIDIPLDEQRQFQPEPYVGLLPMRPPILHGPADAFSTHVHGIPVGPYAVNVLVGVMPSPLIDHSGILVDLDVFSLETMDIDLLTERLHGVRDVKNAIFESILNDAARETFRG